MPSNVRVHCQVCGKHESEVGVISWRGKCIACAKRLEQENSDALHYHRGPGLLHWRRQTAHSIGAVLLDDLPREVVDLLHAYSA